MVKLETGVVPGYMSTCLDTARTQHPDVLMPVVLTKCLSVDVQGDSEWPKDAGVMCSIWRLQHAADVGHVASLIPDPYTCSCACDPDS